MLLCIDAKFQVWTSKNLLSIFVDIAQKKKKNVVKTKPRYWSTLYGEFRVVYKLNLLLNKIKHNLTSESIIKHNSQNWPSFNSSNL